MLLSRKSRMIDYTRTLTEDHKELFRDLWLSLEWYGTKKEALASEEYKPVLEQLKEIKKRKLGGVKLF